MSLSSLSTFIEWFTSQGGVVNTNIVGFKDFEEYGRGTVALQDIEEGSKLFTLPRFLTLSTQTCQLPRLLNDSHQTWKKFELHKGWVGLILCMLWEDAKGSQGKWGGYLNSLPTAFDTPMFWSDTELVELKGGCVEDKIGKVEAEKDYLEKLLPAVKSRPDVFSPSQIETLYTIERYHMMGTRILSRSFNVEAAESGNERPIVDGGISNFNEAHVTTDMDIDTNHGGTAENDEQASNSEGSSADSDDEDDQRNVAMVPFADILNARYGCANAKLFYEEHHLGMIAIKPIKAGEQIWNTYGDLPNSDLLRRYGHIDLFPLDDGSPGSPADIAEVRADLIARETVQKLTKEEVNERVDWWLEEGGDDGFILDVSYQLPDMLVSFVRLLMDASAWEAARDRGKVPKPKTDLHVREVCKSVLQKRLSLYPTTLKEDEAILKEISGWPADGDRSLFRRRCAIHVRIGEKRVLIGALELLNKVISEDTPKTERGKRKPSGEIQREPSHKKRR